MNIELLRDGVLRIEKESHRPAAIRDWNQGTWFRIADEVRNRALVSLHWYKKEGMPVPFTQEEVNSCGTQACFCGHMVYEAGLVDVEHGIPDLEALKDRFPEHDWDQYFYGPPTIGRLQEDMVDEDCWSKIGEALLGITQSEADLLFNGDNSADEVANYAREIAKAHGEVL